MTARKRGKQAQNRRYFSGISSYPFNGGLWNFGHTSAPILYLGVRTCEIFLYIIPVIYYIDYYVPRLYFLHYSRVLQVLQRGRASNLAFPLIRKSREASVHYLRPNPSPFARP